MIETNILELAILNFENGYLKDMSLKYEYTWFVHCYSYMKDLIRLRGYITEDEIKDILGICDENKKRCVRIITCEYDLPRIPDINRPGWYLKPIIFEYGFKELKY